MLWASWLCINACDIVCRSVFITRNDQRKRETKVTFHSQVISPRVLNQFLLSEKTIERIYGTLIKLEVQTL